MTRTKPPPRRPSMTRKIDVELDAGKIAVILITVGFGEGDLPVEVFCASFKAGTAMNAIVSDACILMSRLLQLGDSPAAILAGMSGGPSEKLEGMPDSDHRRSLVGRIAEAVAELDAEVQR